MPVKRSKLVQSLIGARVLGKRARTIHDTWLRYRIPKTYEAKNRLAQEALLQQRSTLTGTAAAVVKDIMSRGIAHVPIAEIIPDTRLRHAIKDIVRGWTETTSHRSRVEQVRDREYLNPKGKPYEIKMHAHGERLSYSSPFIRVGVAPTIVDIVAAYLGCLPRLMHADAWHTVSIDRDVARQESQNWHRDPEDAKLIKVFWYLTAVDEESGALEYIQRSRPGEKYGAISPQRTPYGAKPECEALEAAVLKTDRIVCAVPADHVVFVDTVGFHRGGRARLRDRLLATWEYATQASWWERSFIIDGAPPSDALPVHERFALS